MRPFTLAVKALVGAALVVQVLAQTPARADAGDLDPSFGRNGRVTTDLAPGSTTILGVAIQGNGKIVAAGCASATANGCVTGDSSDDFALARYLPDGTLDESFGQGGIVVTDFTGSSDVAHAVAVQGDGKLVVAGTSVRADTPGFAVARYNRDGSLDPSFGEGGMAFTDFSGGGAYGLALALQWDGKIVVAGTTVLDIAVARFDRDGTLDPTFGGDGTVTTDISHLYESLESANAVAIQGDGRILVAGTRQEENCCATSQVALARYDPDGSLDDSFGRTGTVVSGVGGGASGVAVQWNGKIVVAANASRFAVARYNLDGTLDRTFGHRGAVYTDFAGPSVTAGMAIQGNGRIVVAGSAFIDGQYDFAVARYLATGALDPDFGIDGKVMTNFAGRDDVGHALALQGNGKIVVAGDAQLGENLSSRDFALARYL